MDVLYAATLDASARARGHGLLFQVDADHRLHRIDLAGNDVVVPWTPFPATGVADVRDVSLAATRDGRWRAIILAATSWGAYEGVHAGRYDYRGRMACTYSRVFDDATFGADGDLLVARSEDALQFFGSDCKLRALVPEPHLHYWVEAAIAPDNSVVVFGRERALAARAATGELLWVHALLDGETLDFADPPVVSRGGRVTAFQPREVVSPYRRRAVVLNDAGVVMHTLAQPILMIDAISANGSRLLTDNLTTASLIDTSTGATVFETTPQATMTVREAAMSRSAKTVALLWYLDPFVPGYSEKAYPHQYRLTIHRSSAEPSLMADIPRVDVRIANDPPGELASVLLADDGAYALVAFPRHLALFALGSE